jgi:hypothetical protein
MEKFNIASLKARLTASLKDRPSNIKIALVVAATILGIWFLNYITDGAFLVLLGWLLFLSALLLILALISPSGTVQLVKQVKEESAAYWAQLKRSIQELRELLKKKPVIVVDPDSEPKGPADGSTPVAPPSAATAAPTTTAAAPRKSRRTTPPADAVSAPVVKASPVASSASVPVDPDGLARVAAATSRAKRGTSGGRKLGMPGDDK